VRAILTLVLLAVTISIVNAQRTDDPAAQPVDLGQQEEVEVRLVLIDAVVLDRQDRTVSDLTLDDFEITVDGRRLPIDTLDVSCAAGSLEDPEAVKNPKRRAPISTDAERNIVLALDYLHLNQIERVDVLEQAQSMVRQSMTANDRIMVAALNGGLRIEQVFTADHGRVLDTLKRMEYDISLWEPSFFHLNEDPFFDGMQVLFDVLGSVPGNKGVVLFSNNPGSAHENDLRFADLAAGASSSRCSVYPVHASGLTAARPG
jgi:VWFA-related protein